MSFQRNDRDDHGSKRQRLNNWKVDNNGSDGSILSLEDMLLQRPINWETILGRIAQEQATAEKAGTVDPLTVVSERFFVRALHLASDGLNTDTRINDMAYFMQLLSSVPQDVRIRGITSVDPDETEPQTLMGAPLQPLGGERVIGTRGKTPLHKACARHPIDNSFSCVGQSNNEEEESHGMAATSMNQALALPIINLLLNCLKLDTNGACPGICVQDDEGKTCLHYAVDWIVGAQTVVDNYDNAANGMHNGAVTHVHDEPTDSAEEDLPPSSSEWFDNDQDEENMPNEWLVDDDEDENNIEEQEEDPPAAPKPASAGAAEKNNQPQQQMVVKLSPSESALADLIELFKEQKGLILQDNDGNTPLMSALLSRLENSDHSVESVLLDACPEAMLFQNRRGYTPLHGLVEYVMTSSEEDEEDENQQVERDDAAIARRERILQHIVDLFRRFVMRIPPSLFAQVMTLQTHEEGYTPLHFACAATIDREFDVVTRARNGIFEVLLHTRKNSNDCIGQEQLTLPNCDGNEENSFFRVTDHEGYTPLHLAVVRGAPNGIIAFLILMEPKACLSKDPFGYTPLYKAFHAHADAIRSLVEELDRHENEIKSKCLSDADRGLALRRKLSKEQKRLVSLLAMLAQGQCCQTDVAPPTMNIALTSLTIEDEDCCAFSLEHNLVHCASSVACPTDVFHVFVKLYRDQLDRYIDGELPLHRWCRNQIVPPYRQIPSPMIPDEDEGDGPEGDSSAFTTDLEDEEDEVEDDYNDQEEFSMQEVQRRVDGSADTLLGGAVTSSSTAPSLSPSLLRNKRRCGNRREILELILRYAPKTSLLNEDNCGKTAVTLAIEHDRMWEGEIELLLKASPWILYSQDPDSNLYPFMLAASIGNTVKQFEDGLVQSETVYAKQKDLFRRIEDAVLSGSQGLKYIEYEHSRKIVKKMKVDLTKRRENVDMERRRMDTIFHLLLAQPSLVLSGIPQQQKEVVTNQHKQRQSTTQKTRMIKCKHCHHVMEVPL